MPSTTTSSLTIGSIFDLIGLGAPSAPAAADSSGFDSLLQSPPPQAPPPPPNDPPPQNPAPRTDRDQRRPAAAESTSTDAHSAPDPAHSDDPHNESTAQSASKNPPTIPAESPQAAATPPTNSKPQQEAEQIDAQSLAALAAVNSTIKPAPPKPDPATAEEPPTDPKPGIRLGPPSPGNRTVTIANATANAQNTGAASRSASKEAAEKDDVHAAGGQSASITDKQNAAAAKAAAVAAATNQNSSDRAPAVDPLLAAQAETAAKFAEASDANAPSPKDQHHDNAHTPSDAAINAETILTAPTPDVASTGPASITPPAIVPLTAQTPLPDSARSQANSQPASQSPAIAPSGPRSRLPADVLAPAAQTTNRRPNVEIDTTRLLTRVARAVTTAQERDGEVRLRLSPPELGSLRLDVKVQDGALVAHLQTETDAARTAILDNLPALRDRLADQGVRIERFDVDLMQRQPGGMADQPGGRQQEPMPPEARVVLPPRATTNPVSPNSLPSVPRPVSPAGGLNVIV